MPNTSRFFIAIIPPEDISAEITSFKQELADAYNTQKALRVMPHITLKAPFAIDSNKEATVLKWFSTIETNATPFQIELNGFGAFDNPKNPVLFVKPKVSIEMRSLQKDILTAFKNQFPAIPVHFHEEEFHPHMTIGYRDLAYAEFEKARAAFNERNYHAAFTNNDFHLLKHNGSYWEILSTKKLYA